MLPALALYGSILAAAALAGPDPSAPTQRPRWRGVGLSVAAGVTGTLGVAANITRIGVVQRACAGIGAGSDLERAVTDCIRDSQTYLTFSALAPLASASALGLATGAGIVNGRYRGYRANYGRQRGVATSTFIGAGLLSVSVIAHAIAQVGMWRDLYGVRGCVKGAELSSDCVRARWSGWLGAVAASQAGAIVGAGLFAFGVSHRIHRGRRLQPADLSLRPTLSLTHAGVRLSGRF